MSKRIGEQLATTLRRHQQIQKHFKTHPIALAKKSVSPLIHTSLSQDDATEHKLQSVPSWTDHSIQGAQNLKLAVERGIGMTPTQRQTAQAITMAETKEEVTETFLLLAQSSNKKINERLIETVCSKLVQLETKKRMGDQVFTAVVEDASGDNDRWKGLSRQEEHALVLFHANRLIRTAEKNSVFDPQLGRVVEGSDNVRIGHIAHQIQKSVGTSIASVPWTALTDLMYLDISWGVALRLYLEAKTLGKGVDPPVEMADRVLGLMTAYRSHGIGSRPWEAALELYERVVHSGYSTTLATHTHALDALWRSAERFHRKHTDLTDDHRNKVWSMMQTIRRNVKEAGLRVAGDSGCAYMEGLVKASAAAGRWQAVIALVSEMDLTEEDTSVRFLIPTPETFLFAIAACNVVGHHAHADGLLKMFEGHYTFEHPHSESLLFFLQSLRQMLHFTNNNCGEILERVLLQKRKTLSRPCVVAALQLLSSRRVTTEESKEDIAVRLYAIYDDCIWLQEPIARKTELQTVFRCCYLISAFSQGIAGNSISTLIPAIRKRIRGVFGLSSMEEKWLDDTAIHMLFQTDNWKQAIQLFEQYSARRQEDPDVALPLFQVRQGLLDAFLRCCRNLCSTTDGGDASLFLDEDDRQAQRDEVVFIAQLGIERAEALFPSGDLLHESLAELLLFCAMYTPNMTERKRILARSLRYYSFAPQSCLSNSILRRISDVSGLTEEHIQVSLSENHFGMRWASLHEDTEKDPLLYANSW